jgi:tetratricopeptide (TPR) repeat protein
VFTRLPFISTVVAILLLAAIWAHEKFSQPNALLQILPELDLSTAESQVVKKILDLRHEVEKNPEVAASWGRFAMNLYIHDMKQESIPCFKVAVELDSTDFRWPYYCAIVLSEMGSPDAVKWFERCKELSPDYMPVHVLYGQVLLDQGRLEDASEEFHLAKAIGSQSSHTYIGLAQVALSKDDLETSRRYLLQAIEIDPSHADAHGLLAQVHQRLNDRENADREMRIVEQLPRNTPMRDSIYKNLVNEGVSSYWYEIRGQGFVANGQFAYAVKEFRKALEVKPSPQAHNNLGIGLQFLGKHKEAIDHHRTAIALKPSYPNALNNLATALYQTGNVEESIVHLEEAKRLDPAFADVYVNLGTFQARLGRVYEAIQTYRQGLANAPYDPRTATRLAWLLATTTDRSLRNGPEAVEVAETVCEFTDFQVPDALDALAAAYAETQEFGKASPEIL